MKKGNRAVFAIAERRRFAMWSAVAAIGKPLLKPSMYQAKSSGAEKGAGAQWPVNQRRPEVSGVAACHPGLTEWGLPSKRASRLSTSGCTSQKERPPPPAPTHTR